MNRLLTFTRRMEDHQAQTSANSNLAGKILLDCPSFPMKGYRDENLTYMLIRKNTSLLTRQIWSAETRCRQEEASDE
jgi:hypothetical protein